MRKIIKNILFVFVVSLFSFVGGGKAQVNQQMMDASAEQAQGMYTPMNMGYAGFNSLGMTQAAWLDPMQNLGEGQSKPAYSRYYWSPDLVLPIRVREGMITMLNFPDWELIEDIFIGDAATFDGQISGPNTLFLYPRKGANVGVDTNVIVFGRSGNRYVFYVKSEGVNTERLTNAIIDIDVVDAYNPSKSSSETAFSGSGRATGSNGGKLSTYTKRNQFSDWIKSIPVNPEEFRFDLEVYVPNPDDVVIAPERVWRDSIFTYIDLGEKALTMTQRPVVSMIVERVEVPVGFRTKGPDNRLIIVEGIGDMVLRNGKRIICIKMRRSDDKGLEYAINSEDYLPPKWDVAPKIPDNKTGAGDMGSINYFQDNPSVSGQLDIQQGQSQIIVPEYTYGGSGYQQNGRNIADSFDYSKMQKIGGGNSMNNEQFSQMSGYTYGSGFKGADNSSISIELGADSNVSGLETLWGRLSSEYDELSGFTPYYSVDAPADGNGKELFHLRVGPVKNLKEGDSICSKLGENGVFCSVVRTQ